MKNLKLIIGLMALMMGFQMVSEAQNVLPGYHLVDPASLTTKSENPLDFHLSMSTGFVSAWGESTSYVAVAPSLSYKINDEWKIKAGFALVSDIDSYLTPQCKSFAPYRSGTSLGAASVRAEYQPNDHFRMATTAFYLGGQYDPLFCHQPGSLPMSVYGVNASFQFKTAHNNTFELNVSVLHDDYGTAAPLLWYDPMMYSYHGGFGCGMMNGGFGFGSW